MHFLVLPLANHTFVWKFSAYSGFVYPPEPWLTICETSTFLYAAWFATIASTSAGGSPMQCASTTLSPELIIFTASSADIILLS